MEPILMTTGTCKSAQMVNRGMIRSTLRKEVKDQSHMSAKLDLA